MSISIGPFYGMSPKISPRLLRDGGAVAATNMILTSGQIRPIKEPELVHTPDFDGPWQSVFRAVKGDEEKWLAWNNDVDVVRAPLPPSAEPRFYWSGDGEPRYGRFAGLPSTFFALGIPKPQTPVSISVSGGSGANVTRVYAYTFISELGEESGLSPVSNITTGKVDGIWELTDFDVLPTNAGSGTASHSLGVTTFTNTALHWLRAGDEIVIAGQTVKVQSILLPTDFTILGDFSVATSWERKAPWNTSNMYRRLYRTTGTNGTFQLVADNIGTSYFDTLTDAQIFGDELISLGWEPPPTNLKGLTALPNGSVVGFFDNQICYSEPYQPHAWPIAYRRATAFDVVGIGHYGTTVIACTESDPYICDGTEPSVVRAESANEVWPCLSKRSVVNVGDGVMFATAYGMAYIGMQGKSIWTKDIYNRVDWSFLNPSSMVAAKGEGRILVRFISDDNSKGVLVFDQDNPEIGLTLISEYPDEIYTDLVNGSFYFVDDLGVRKYDTATGGRASYFWLSKEYELPRPMNYGACKVDFESEQSLADANAEISRFEDEVNQNEVLIAGYKGLGSINGSAINQLYIFGSNLIKAEPPAIFKSTVTIYAKPQNSQTLKPVFSKILGADESSFRLPSGFKSDIWQVGITGNLRIKSVKLAESFRELGKL